ncbi:uncharacterized protein L969DRAFT_93157 [Mixia osmundae IAM 14324]|uniref:Peptidase M48 domain-containing protein n=1 Tax=Mixia osmundae (strain CBS 9802 / IAM 14324 / JCM 22182 / KY 12970) TaxID=764103 RepID=G7E5X5_MIXOS|nr:uncharacterized protein L969DRAFT_93157 [Mixia osmundae IAM 14324]KEI40613.1 hypothetical protein L969DRAFT_93157 [Mixia osmundae IAM 14324]GAA98235.1 hypothetical protein E5Q_04918 [Mixia osmundae IAM 14324]
MTFSPFHRWRPVTARYLSNTASRSAMPVVIVALLKSSAFTSALQVASKTALSLFPLAKFGIQRGPKKTLVYWILLTPFALMLVAVLAAAEQTPITGRWRTLYISDEEKRALQQTVLPPGSATHEQWKPIVDQLLARSEPLRSSDDHSNEQRPCRIIPESDWRYIWLKDTLGKLQLGVNALATETLLAPDDLQQPLPKMPFDPDNARAEYDVLLVEKDDVNAFAFGIGNRGVIIVFSGLVDYITHRHASERVRAPPTQPVAASQMETRWIHGLFGGLFNSLHPTDLTTQATPSAPTQKYEPTLAETKSMAILLSHELSHLILDHTIEAYSTMKHLWPSVRHAAVDITRTILYPFTALFGPFVNDAVKATLDEFWGVNAARSESDRSAVRECMISEVCERCASFHREVEADAVSLRILSNSGIDPRLALGLWTDLAKLQSSDPKETVKRVSKLRSELQRWGAQV